jgi:hypothetical protein
VQLFVFPDTNVLLHFRFSDQVDWAAELGADEVTLIRGYDEPCAAT